MREKDNQPVGIFDSGVGGLSVLRHIRTALPQERLIYFADQAHVPYGSRSLAEIREFCIGITRFLLAQGAKLIVVACNTATGAALTTLRSQFDGVAFVGMEPAVKPAALKTRSGKVGVLATESTFSSPRYAQLMSRFAADVEVLEDPCRGLVPLIEAGQTGTSETEEVLRRVLEPMLAAGVDTLVLGCTHYSFVLSLIDKIIEQIVIERPVTIIDPAPAVARQTAKVLAQRQLLSSGVGQEAVCLLTSLRTPSLALLSNQVLGEFFPIQEVRWNDLSLASA